MIDTTVIISTYNSPQRLEKTLWGYLAQSVDDFEVVVADDGSTEETTRLLESYQPEFETRGIPLRQVWHADFGFQKNRILNRALCEANGEYCIFTDGDCIPRNDFVEAHRTLRRPGRFLAIGSHINLKSSVHTNIDRDDISSGRAFAADWLGKKSLLSWSERMRLTAGPSLRPWLNLSTHRPSVFTGNGSSVWRDAALAINGFDERMRYGGEDKDFGFRLTALGLTSKMCKFSLICLHQDHPRPYVEPKVLAANRRHLRRLKWGGRYWTDDGISKNAASRAA